MEWFPDSRQPCLFLCITPPVPVGSWACDRKHGTADGCGTAHCEFVLINDLRPVLGVQRILLLSSGLLACVSEIYMRKISGPMSGQLEYGSSYGIHSKKKKKKKRKRTIGIIMGGLRDQHMRLMSGRLDSCCSPTASHVSAVECTEKYSTS
jgi:hypothetical protein